MRIAMVSTPFVPVPPTRYGGTELVVAELVQGLCEGGHEVTLFATGDSHADCDLRGLYATGSWPPDPVVELDHASWAVGEILADARPFDVVHAHVPAMLPFSSFLDVPLVYTIHHERDERLARIYARHRAHYVAISERQRELCPEIESVVIHHGLSPGQHRFGGGRAGYALFLGRLAEQKGVHRAIDVAQAANVRLLIGGQPHWHDVEYYERHILPRLGQPGLEMLGEVYAREKAPLLGDAIALLFPISWEEPFGLVMIEAMLCGTPVLAFARGSVPEIVEDGVTGFVCADEEEMSIRLRQIARLGFDRRRCRARALERWSAQRMVREHLALYHRLAERWEPVDVRATAPVA